MKEINEKQLKDYANKAKKNAVWIGLGLIAVYYMAQFLLWIGIVVVAFVIYTKLEEKKKIKPVEGAK